MSGLRQEVLEWIRTAGNHSGCHQMPERSFFYQGKQFPVCARCTGVFIGQVMAFVLLFIKKDIKTPAIFTGLLAVMGIDWSLQEFKVKESTNRRRLITGICGGLGLFSFYIWMMKKIIEFLKIQILSDAGFNV